jgi:general secretion pathway protein G
MKTRKHKTNMLSHDGFTLLEILIAISIVVILGGIVSLQLIDMPQKSRRDAAVIQLGTFKTAIQIYIADNGFPPSQRQGLEALVSKPATPPIPLNYRPNGYLDSKEVPKDPWGGDYVYLSPGSGGELFEIICYGSDGDEGGEGYAADLSTLTP